MANAQCFSGKVVAGTTPASNPSAARAKDRKVRSGAHRLRIFTIRWQYATKYELPRTTKVTATNVADAKAIVMRDHLEPSSALREAITWLDVSVDRTS